MGDGKVRAADLASSVGTIGPAGKLPLKGVVDVTDCSSGRLEVIASPCGDFWATWTHTGTRRANVAGGPFDRMSGRATGMLWVTGGTAHGQGAHEYVDADGDKVFIESQRLGARTTWKFAGGSGKYEGITGNGEYSDLNYFPRLSTDTYQFCPVSTGTYEIVRQGDSR